MKSQPWSAELVGRDDAPDGLGAAAHGAASTVADPGTGARRMRFEYRDRAGLPKLAWLASCEFAEGRARVYHGSAVETRPAFFIEGVWDGPFEPGEFAATDCVFGSGAVIDGETVVFVPSTATTDYLYYRRDDARLVVSNSLPLLLSFLGDELDPRFLGYADVNNSIMKGIKHYGREIPTRGGSVRRLMHCNLEATAGGLREVEKPLPPPFASYEEYRGYLGGKLEAVFRNARDAARARPLRIVSTQSKGYDTTALNALAAPFGLDEVFTVSQGKGSGYHADRDRDLQVDDDGTEICRVLNLPCTQVDRRVFEDRFLYEKEFYSTNHMIQDANFLGFFEHMSDVSVIITGTQGEIWYPKEIFQREWESYEDNADLTRPSLALSGLAEVRLVVGFIQMAPIYLGMRRFKDIERITESPSMDPWRLGTDYDRPIARRIAEEAGVPRGLFGQVKMASVVEFAKPRVPWNPPLREDYFAFLRANRLLAGWQVKLFPLVHKINWMLAVRNARFRAIYYAERILARLTGNPRFCFPRVWNRLDGSIYCYCVNRRVAEFAPEWAGDRP